VGRSRSDFLESVVTGAFAVAACFAADPAMLMRGSVLFAFLRTSTAGTATNLQQLREHVRIAPGASRRESARSQADIGAVEIQADALPQLLHARLGEARISATRTHLRAIETFLDAANERRRRFAVHVRMRGNHCLRSHRGTPDRN
jgi:hypothetical protein